MKKIFSLVMVLLVILSCVFALPASAADSAKTEVSVNKGDEVIYTLYLSDVPKKVVGCDFSVYYDSSEYKVKEYADFSGSFSPDDHQALINPNLAGEVRGNWSILSGVAFKNRKPVVSVKFEALKKANTHISYYVRYLYPDDMVQFTQYTFSCDVVVNKTTVIENQAPELNVEEEQSVGEFINSVTGNGADADVNMVNKKPANSNGTNGGDKNENTVSNPDANTSSSKTSSNTASNTSSSKPVSTVTSDEGVDEPEESVTILDPASPDEAGESAATSAWLWIILALVVIGGAAGVTVLLVKKTGKSEDK